MARLVGVAGSASADMVLLRFASALLALPPSSPAFASNLLELGFALSCMTHTLSTLQSETPCWPSQDTFAIRREFDGVKVPAAVALQEGKVGHT